MVTTGPPLSPHPIFRVVNATHIEVKWDKPYANPEFDIQYYNLTIINMEDDSREVYTVIPESTYPMRYYVDNGGVIPKRCEHLQFNVTATNPAGTSPTGSIVGGFAVGKSLHVTIAT